MIIFINSKNRHRSKLDNQFYRSSNMAHMEYAAGEHDMVKSGTLFWLYNQTIPPTEVNRELVQRRTSCIHKPVDLLLICLGGLLFSISMVMILTCPLLKNQFMGFIVSIFLIIVGIVNLVTLETFSVVAVVVRFFCYMTTILVLNLQLVLEAIKVRQWHEIIHIQNRWEIINCTSMGFIFYVSIGSVIITLVGLCVCIVGILLTADALISIHQGHNQINPEDLNNLEISRALPNYVIGK